MEFIRDRFRGQCALVVGGPQGIGKAIAVRMAHEGAEAGLASYYNASKAGLFLLAKTLARELGPYGINSIALGPGLIQTRLTAPAIRNKNLSASIRI